jgi:hypothetical protein
MSGGLFVPACTSTLNGRAIPLMHLFGGLVCNSSLPAIATDNATTDTIVFPFTVARDEMEKAELLRK